MRRVIVNSTPLIALSNIDQLELLKAVYGEIIIPDAVFREVTEKPDSACNQIRHAHDWIHVVSIKDQNDKKMYRARLHAGEVEVMIFAQEEPKADLVILDDAAAKKTAKYLGLTVTGTLGILIKAQKMGLIKDVKPLLDNLCKNGFFISDKVMQLVLKQINE